MAMKKFVVGCFEDEKVLFPAVAKVRKAGYKIHDVYTPFPVHGLDKAMGLRDTSLHTAGFLFGLIGTTTAVTFMTWVFTKDWPVNIGDICQLAPFVKRHHFHARATDDLFVMVIECGEKTNESELSSFLNSAGATEINTQVAEEGWWIGRYDKEQELYKQTNIA